MLTILDSGLGISVYDMDLLLPWVQEESYRFEIDLDFCYTIMHYMTFKLWPAGLDRPLGGLLHKPLSVYWKLVQIKYIKSGQTKQREIRLS